MARGDAGAASDLDLLVDVHRLPHVVLRASEDAKVADDLARPLGALADALDHRVEVLERVVHLAGVPLGLKAGAVALGEGSGAVACSLVR